MTLERWTLVRLDRANTITLLGLVASSLALLFASGQRIWSAMVCVLVAGAADVLDGWVARRDRRQKEARDIGHALDSLADVVNFGVCPPLVLWLIGFRTTLIAILVVAFPVLAALRLAWFQRYGLDSAGRFEGFPVTLSSFTLVLFYILDCLLKADGSLVGSALLILGVGFVTRVPVPRLM